LTIKNWKTQVSTTTIQYNTGSEFTELSQQYKHVLCVNGTKERMTKSVRNGDSFWRAVLQHLADEIHEMSFFDTTSHDVRLQTNSRVCASYMTFRYYTPAAQ